MNELITRLMEQLGIQKNQAQGGAGLLFKMAQEKLGSSDFNKVSSALGNVQDLIKAAPETNGASSLLGDLASAMAGGGAGGAAGGLASLAQLVVGFTKLKLDKEMIAKFVSIILSFAQNRGGGAVKAILQKAFQGI